MYQGIAKVIVLTTAMGIAGWGQTVPLAVTARVLDQHYCRVPVSAQINMIIDLKVRIANLGKDSVQIDALYDPVGIWFGRTPSDLQSKRYELHFQQDALEGAGDEPIHKVGAIIQPGESVEATKVVEVTIQGTPFGNLSDGDHYMRMVSGILVSYKDRYLSHQAEIGPLLVNVKVPVQLPSCGSGDGRFK